VRATRLPLHHAGDPEVVQGEADSAVVTRNPAEQIRWWEAFHDPVLGQLVEIAYQNNYNLKVAGLRVGLGYAYGHCTARNPWFRGVVMVIVGAAMVALCKAFGG